MSASIVQPVDSRLKGISVEVLEKIRTTEAIKKASAFDENEWKLRGDLKRLPEIAFMLQIMFTARKKNSLPREEVIENIIRTYNSCHPTIISRESAVVSFHLVLKHFPEWIQTFVIRNRHYVRLNAHINFETVRAKFDYRNISRTL